MNRLAKIPVKVVPLVQEPDPSRKALPIAHEVAARLEAFVSAGETSNIDLHRLPLTPAEYQSLRSILGQGEVDAQVHALGLTRVRESAIPGVWWVTHYDQDAKVVAQCIEIAGVPEILRSDAGDAHRGLARLRKRLADIPRGSP